MLFPVIQNLGDEIEPSAGVEVAEVEDNGIALIDFVVGNNFFRHLDVVIDGHNSWQFRWIFIWFNLFFS